MSTEQNQRGHAMIELAVSAGVMVACLAGTVQFGYTFYIYNQLVTAVGNGGRYAAMRTYRAASSSDIEKGKAAIRNMVAYGDARPAPNALPQVANLKPEQVQVDVGHGRIRETCVRERLDRRLHRGRRVRNVSLHWKAGRRVSLCGTVRTCGERAMRRSSQRGQSMVEATLVLLVFFTLLLGVIDCGQVLFAHQSLVERVRAAVRWGVVHPWNRRR